MKNFIVRYVAINHGKTFQINNSTEIFPWNQILYHSRDTLFHSNKLLQACQVMMLLTLDLQTNSPPWEEPIT